MRNFSIIYNTSLKINTKSPDIEFLTKYLKYTIIIYYISGDVR